MNRSFTLSSPVQLSRCVLRSTNTFPFSGSVPYHRSRTAMECGCLVIRLWYRPRFTLSRYTEDVIWESAGTCDDGSFSRSMRNTGRCSAMACLTLETSSVATQYLRVVRTKSCTPAPPFGPDPCASPPPEVTFPRSSAKRSDIWTTNTAL